MHRGEIVLKAIRKQDFTVAQLSRKMKVAYRTLYNWFDNPDLPYEKILRIGKQINYDFAQDFDDLQTSKVSEPEVVYESLPLMRRRYLEQSIEMEDMRKKLKELEQRLNRTEKPEHH